VSLAEPAGQKFPGAVQLRQASTETAVEPPMEYVPTGQGWPLGLLAPGQKSPAAQGTPVVDVVPLGQ
jgi:hypothetical protein